MYSAVNRESCGDDRAVDIQCQPSKTERLDNIDRHLSRYLREGFNLGLIKLTKPAGQGPFCRQLLQSAEAGDHGVMSKHTYMGDTSSAGEEHGDQEQDESSDGVVRLWQGVTEAFAQSARKIEAGEEDTNQFETAEGSQAFIFEAKCTRRVDAAAQK